MQLEIINLRVSGFALSNRRSLLLHKSRMSVRRARRREAIMAAPPPTVVEREGTEQNEEEAVIES